MGYKNKENKYWCERNIVICKRSLWENTRMAAVLWTIVLVDYLFHTNVPFFSPGNWLIKISDNDQQGILCLRM